MNWSMPSTGLGQRCSLPQKKLSLLLRKLGNAARRSRQVHSCLFLVFSEDLFTNFCVILFTDDQINWDQYAASLLEV